MGSSGALDLFRRSARTHSSAHAREVLARIGAEVEAERSDLHAIASTIGARHVRALELAASVGERIGRLKLNGALLRRSPLSDLVEVEALLLGVTGKLRLWTALLTLAATDDRLDQTQLQRLADQAENQLEALQHLHDTAAAALPNS